MGITRDQKCIQTLQKALPRKHQHRHRTYETDAQHPHQTSYLLGRLLFRPLIKRWPNASRLLQIRTKTWNQEATNTMENQSRTSRKKIISATLTNFFAFLHRGTLHSSSHLPNKHAHTKNHSRDGRYKKSEMFSSIKSNIRTKKWQWQEGIWNQPLLSDSTSS